MRCWRSDCGGAPPRERGPTRPPSPPPPAAPPRALGGHERAYWESSDIAHALTSLAGLRPRLILANEIAALPLAVRLAGGRSKVLFDAHEYAPGEWDDIWWWRALYGPQAAHLCRRYIPQADAMTTVSQGIAERYA